MSPRTLLRPLCALTLAAGVTMATAQTFPSRFVSMVVPFAAGGSAEVVGRIVANEMTKLLGQNVVVELRPGAGGNVGAEYVARNSKPDGYTMLLGSLSLATNVSLMKLGFDPRKDLVAVAGICTLPNLLVVAADNPVKSVKELIAAARQKPGDLTFGSSGPGTSSHLAGELLQVVSGVAFTHVPYKGSGAVYPDLIGGRVTMLFDLAGSATAQIQGGRVRAIATTGARRSSALPDVPTVAESGYAGFEFGAWLGLFVPTGTPREALARLEESVLKAIQMPAVRDRLTQISADPIPAAAAAFGKFFADDVERYARLVREGKLKPLN